MSPRGRARVGATGRSGAGGGNRVEIYFDSDQEENTSPRAPLY